MRSQKQIETSRANGARSRGPITEQGKKFSARNSVRHGLLAETVVLNLESEERFWELLNDYMEEFQPTTATQVTLVETMTAARWRQLCVWEAQKTAMDLDAALPAPRVPGTERVLFAFRGSSEGSCPHELLLRYEVFFDRQFSRALKNLLLLQSRPAHHPNRDAAKRTQEPTENVHSPDALQPETEPRAQQADPAVAPMPPNRDPHDADAPILSPPNSARCETNPATC